MYGRDLILTGDRRKLRYFAQANANRMGIVHSAGALGTAPISEGEEKFANCGPGFTMIDGKCEFSEDVTVTPPATGCPPGMRTAPNGQCITQQTAGGSGFSFTNFFKSVFGGGSEAKSDPSEWANPYSAAPLVSAGRSPSAGLDALATIGMVIAAGGVLYGFAKNKPAVAIGAVAVGGAAFVIPMLTGGAKNPFAGMR